MIINKISALQYQNSIKPQNIIKKMLPAVGGLSVLAGSSMGPTITPDIPHVPGTSVTDPFIDQLAHTGDMLLDTGSAIGDAVGHGLSNIGDLALDAGCALADSASDLGEQALDALGTLLDSIG